MTYQFGWEQETRTRVVHEAAPLILVAAKAWSDVEIKAISTACQSVVLPFVLPVSPASVPTVMGSDSKTPTAYLGGFSLKEQEFGALIDASKAWPPHIVLDVASIGGYAPLLFSAHASGADAPCAHFLRSSSLLCW